MSKNRSGACASLILILSIIASIAVSETTRAQTLPQEYTNLIREEARHDQGASKGGRFGSRQPPS